MLKCLCISVVYVTAIVFTFIDIQELDLLLTLVLKKNITRNLDDLVQEVVVYNMKRHQP